MSGRQWKISRRQFLIGLGATTGTLALSIKLGLPFARLKLAEFVDEAESLGAMAVEPNSWFEIGADNQVGLYIPKIEMGQGIHTALAQIAAEELGVDWSQITVMPAPTAHGIEDSFGTSGSTSVSSLYTPLREAAASFREMLRTEAAVQLNTPADALSLKGGIFTTQGKQISFGELIAAKQDWELPETTPELKSVSQFEFIGKPISRVDLPAKILGEAIYGYDVRLPNMLYGAVARPPQFNSEFVKASVGTAESKPGVVSVLIDGSFVGVVAESRAATYAGLASLDVEWKDGEVWQQEDLDKLVSVGEGDPTIIQKEGNIDDGLKRGRSLVAEYRTPMAAHAHLEPQAALADYQQDGSLTVYVSSQNIYLVRQDISKSLGIDEEKINVIPAYLGSGFGRRLNVKAAVEAARLSRAVGRPVHVGWNRSEEFRHGYLRPSTHHILRGSVNDQGMIEGFDHQQASGDVAFPFLPAIAVPVLGADFGAWRGGRIHYEGIENRRTVAWRVKMPLATGWWRGLGLLANTFAVESFMDELADLAGVDPIEFRLRHLPEGMLASSRTSRFREVLLKVRELSGWDEPLAEGRARGVACCVDVNTIVAEVAEISIVDGRPRVHQVMAVVDPGLVVNPDGAAAQTQGAIMMGLSSTFFEAVTIKDSRIVPSNFDRYPLLTMKEAPEIDVHFINSGETPFGMGEPPIGPISAAVANAFFQLTGERVRQLPFGGFIDGQ